MLKTFPKGGVHPEENKLTSSRAIMRMPVPKVVYVPIAQHIGIPSEIIVDRKDKVEIGQVIAKSGGFVSSNIHSPVAGSVTKLDMMVDSSGYKKQCIVIRTDQKNESNFEVPEFPLKKEITLSQQDILQHITDYGIVGLGGATFPSHVKLNLKNDGHVDCLIINGVECEPYLTADHRLMLEKAEEIIVGIQILMHALHIEKAVIGIENNKKDAIEVLKQATETDPRIKVAALRVKYPQGSEKQLIRAILNREVPKGGLPMDVGVIVHNVGTIFAIYQAVQYNQPLTERVVTVTGKKLENPSNFWVKIGTPIKDIIAEVGGVPEGTRKIVNGGPMMGKAIKNIDVPITKGTSGILVISEEEASRKEPKNCIRCSQCVFVCPMGLEPHLLMNLSEKGLYERARNEDVMTCIECGSCSYVCPSHRPLLDYIRFGKSIVKKNGKYQRTRMSDQTVVISASPHVHSDRTSKKLMYDVLIALIPAFLVSIYVFGLGALIVTSVAVISCLLFEYVIQKFLLKTEITITDGSALITGVLLAFNLPSSLPIWMVVVGSFVAIGVAKLSFGGLGYNIFNPALVGRVFLLVSFPVQMTMWPTPVENNRTLVDAVTGATPLGIIKEELLYGSTMTEISTKIPSTLDLLLGITGGSVGEMSALALLLGGLYLIVRKVITWHIPMVMLVTMAIFTGVFWFIDPEHYANPLIHLLSGGAILGAFYMATDLVTSPMTKKGMVVFAVGIGVITVVIRLFGAYPEGVSFAIIIMNAFVPLINTYFKPRRFGNKIKSKMI